TTTHCTATGATSFHPATTSSSSETHPSSGSTPRPPSRPQTRRQSGDPGTTATWTTSPAGTPRQSTTTVQTRADGHSSQLTQSARARPQSFSGAPSWRQAGAAASPTARSAGYRKPPAEPPYTSPSSASTRQLVPSPLSGPMPKAAPARAQPNS